MTSNEIKKPNFPDRANLSPEQSRRLEQWVEQIKIQTEESIKISKSDLVNFFLATYPEKLPDNLVIQIEVRQHDESKWLKLGSGADKESKKFRSEFNFRFFAKKASSALE